MNKKDVITKEYQIREKMDLQPGDVVKIHQRIKDIARGKKGKKEVKERVQIFEGTVLSIKHGQGTQGMFTVRKIVAGVGVEKIYPIHSPTIEKIEIIGRSKTRRSKLYYLREKIGKAGKLRRILSFKSLEYGKIDPKQEEVEEKPEETPSPEVKEEVPAVQEELKTEEVPEEKVEEPKEEKVEEVKKEEDAPEAPSKEKPKEEK